MQFPQIPVHKKFGKNDLTPEQEAMNEAIAMRQDISKKNEKILRECRDFYFKAFKFLKNIDLSKITVNEAEAIRKYLDQVFNFKGIIRNDIFFKYCYRITLVKDAFLEDDKVRNPGFISHPPLELVKKMGVYNRANSSNTTVLYCSFHPDIALLEIKPQIGQRIIISEWFKESDEPFVSYPIANRDIKVNEGLLRTAWAFDQVMGQYHPYFRSIWQQYFDFIGTEFIKTIPIANEKKFEYLFSAYFADKVLDNKYAEGDPTPLYDCVIYPSIAATHKTDNIAIHVDSVKKLRPVFMEDCIVVNTRYDNFEATPPNKSLIDRAVVRSSEVIENGRIIWSDD